MKNMLRQATFWLTWKRIAEDQLKPRRLRLEIDQVSWFNLSSNPIVSFPYEGSLYYFRECPRIRDRIRFFREEIDVFFVTLGHLGIYPGHFQQEIPIRIHFSQEEISQFRTYLQHKQKDAAFLKALCKADRIGAKKGFSIWERQSYDDGFFRAFQLTELPESLEEIALYFLWYMRSAAARFRMLPIVRGREHACFAAVRSMASCTVAQELGLPHLLTDCQWCLLEIPGLEPMLGVLSPAAPGMRMRDTRVPLNGTLQRELTNLNLLDVICAQPDHGPNNYNVVYTLGQYQVCAFDNDNPRTFFPSSSVRGSHAGCSPFVGSNGEIARPHLDRKVAQRMGNLDLKALNQKLKPYLNGLQRWTMLRRVGKLRKAIAKTQSSRPDFLCDPETWSEGTAHHEAGGDYGITYLSKV